MEILIALLTMEVFIYNDLFCVDQQKKTFVLVTRGYLPRSILMPLSSLSNSHLPPTPTRRDIPVLTRAPLPLPRTIPRLNYEQSENESPCLINSSNYLEETEPIYLNQLPLSELHQYASIDLEESNEQVYIK